MAECVQPRLVRGFVPNERENAYVSMPLWLSYALPQLLASRMSKNRKLAAILVSDVVDYSQLAGADEERTRTRVRVSAAT
jgi:hypothetical protein